MADQGPSRFRIPRSWLVVIAGVVVVGFVLAWVISNPALSPFPRFRDSDADGVPDAQDLWDAGNGGLIVRVEVFELLSGFCDFFFVFKLEILSEDDVIDIHPDPESTAGWIRIWAPFRYVQFVLQGDQEPVGRITYSVEATGV